MENKMQVIISTAIRFTTEADVAAYKALSFEALPREDVEYNEVTRFIVGYEHIVLFGANGRRLAVLKRDKVRGMAIDDEPVTVNGNDFRPFSTESLEIDTMKALLNTLGRDYDTRADIKKFVEVDKSGLTVHAVDSDTGEALGDFKGMLALVQAYPDAERFIPNDEPDTDENDWPVAVIKP